MAATVWTGYLTFGLISMPVRLYSGARGERVSMHMLHRDDLTRIKTQLYCPNDERVVDRSEIVKGYEYRKGEYVVVDPEEIKKIQPKTAKAMEILEFVKAEDVDPIYFESSLLSDARRSRDGAPMRCWFALSKTAGILPRQAHHAQPRVHVPSSALQWRPVAAHHVLPE